MGIDIYAYKTLYNHHYHGLNVKDEVSSFTLSSSRLNDYWGAYHLFLNNYDDILTEEEYPQIGHNVYIFTIDTIKKLLIENSEKEYGQDVTIFLTDIIISGLDKVYIQVF